MGPLVLIATGAYGIAQLASAHDKSHRAEQLAISAQRRFEDAQRAYVAECQDLSNRFEDFGLFKRQIMENEFQYLVDALNKRPISQQQTIRAEYKEEQFSISADDLNKIQYSLPKSHSTLEKITGGLWETLGTGTVLKALVTKGGLRVGLGTVASSIALPVSLIIAGLSADAEAEKRMTEAKSFEASIDIAIAEMKRNAVIFKAIRSNIFEVENVIHEALRRYRRVQDRFREVHIIDQFDMNRNPHFKSLIAVGKGLKGILEAPLLQENFLPQDDSTIKLTIKKTQNEISLI